MLPQSATDILCTIHQPKHLHHCRNLTSYTMGEPLLCWTLLCVRWRLIHWSRRSAAVVPLGGTPLNFSLLICLRLSFRVPTVVIIIILILCWRTSFLPSPSSGIYFVVPIFPPLCHISSISLVISPRSPHFLCHYPYLLLLHYFISDAVILINLHLFIPHTSISVLNLWRIYT